MSDQEERVIAEGWITTSEAVDATGYASEYLRRLARTNKLRARKFAGRWIYHEPDLVAYKRRMDTLGRKKHDPRGPDHARGGE